MPTPIALPQFPPGAFARQDDTEDAAFYASPRLVTHIDAGAIAALTAYYRDTMPPGGALLDLMSSWVSHLPDDVAYGEVIGHGMNAEELAANPRLNRWFVQDLNQDWVLPLDSARLDAAMICVSIQYLQRPLELLQEVARVLRPGASLVVSFSNRCFPTKAVAVWRALDSAAHARLVDLYLNAAGFHDVATYDLADGRGGDPLTAVVGRV
jgi:SAM-dependent methyltransferase